MTESIAQKTEKPVYRIPSMAEINALPKNGFKVASTFSGAGGSCLGYKIAGFEVVWANEFIPAAARTYEANFPGTILDRRDIRTVQAEEILAAANLKKGELDLFDGSPPCDPFSISGKREKKWGKVKNYSTTNQRTDDLSFEYIRLLEGLKPKVFVMENVAGLLYGTAKGYFKDILQRLKGCGYRVAVRLLDAQWLGVPQMRQRTIFVGVREDLPFEPVHPKPFPYRFNLRDAFGETDELAGEAYFPKPRTKLYKLWHWTVENNKYCFDDAHSGIYGTKSMFNHRRVSFDLPCPTIMQGSRHLYHPMKPRTLSIPELKRAASFPHDFNFTGTFAHSWERIGNCVPPLMMSAVAAAIRDSILLPNLEREKL